MPTSMENSRPQLNHDELQLSKWLLGGVLSLLALWTVFYVESSSNLLAVFASLLVIGSMASPGLSGRVPAFVQAASVPVLVIIFAADLILGTPFLEALIRLSMLLLALRACLPRTRREDLQLVVLGLFLVVVTGVLTVSLLFGVQILLFSAAAMLYLFVVTLSEAARTGTEPDSRRWTELSILRLLLRLRQAINWRLGLLGAVLLVSLVAISAVLFLALPRVQLDSQLDFLGVNRMGSTTGFSDRMELSTVTNIREDQSRVLRVEVDDPSVLPDVPYWRMVVLDEYRSGGFRESAALRLAQQHLFGRRGLFPGQYDPDLRRTEFRIYLEEGVGRYLPLTGSFERLILGDKLDVRVNPFTLTAALTQKPPRMIGVRVLGMEASGTVLEDRSLLNDVELGERTNLHETTTNPFGYSIYSNEAPGTGMIGTSYPETTMDVPVSLEDRALLAQWVAEIRQGRTLGPLEFATAAVDWLGVHHSYSMQSELESELPPGRDIVVRWIQSNGAGHCEYFAAAFALLARTAGVPTRVVAGFKGGSWNRQDVDRPYISVRNSEAHAWCEVYVGGGAWHIVETTPGGLSTGPSVGGLAASLGQDRGFSAWLDSLRMAWYRRVISFNDKSQEQLVGRVRETAMELAISLREQAELWATQFRNWINRPWDPDRVIDLVALLAVLGSVGYLATYVWRRRLWLVFASGSRLRLDAVRREASRWLRRLRLAEERHGGGKGDGDEVRLSLERLRWGPPRERAEALRELERCRRAVRRLERGPRA